DEKGKFVMRFLDPESNDMKEMTVEDSEVRIDFTAVVTDENNKPIPNLLVFLKDDKKKTIGSDTTDAEGKLNFKKLLTDKNYLLEFDEEDTRLSGFQKIVMKTVKGKVIKEIIRSKDGFAYHILKGDQSELNDLYIDDPWLSVLNFKNSQEKKEIVIEEKVQYSYGSFAVDEAAEKILNKVVQIMKDNPNITIELVSHTDSQSSSEFNQRLSEKRARAAVDYVVKMGISRKRLKAIGYGESQLKNKCADGVVCSEDEHAENRRTEFRVVSEKK
ncbi:MAG TPA: OmpA family protein, partial [Bacteroidia bacterium]